MKIHGIYFLTAFLLFSHGAMAQENTTSKIEQLIEFFEQWNYVDQDKIGEFYNSIDQLAQEDPVKAIEYVRKRVDNVRDSQEKMILESQLLQELLKQDPENEFVLYEYGYLLSLSGYRSEAITIFQKILKINPAPEYMHYIHFSLGAAYAALDQPFEAIAHLREVIPYVDRVNKDTAVGTHILLGNSYDEINEREKMYEHYKAALQLDPAYAPAYINLASALNFDKKYEEALPRALKGAELAKSSFAYKILGNTYKGLGKVDESLEQYQKAVKLNPKDKVAFLELGNTHVQLGHYDTAKQAYAEALALDPNYMPALFGMGWVSNKLSNYDEAVDYIQKGLRFDPNDGFGLKELAYAFYGKEGSLGLDEFEKVYLEAANLDQKAYQLLVEGKLKDAIVILEQAIQLMPYQPLVLMRMAYAHYHLNDYPAAEPYLRKALLMNPYNAELAKNLACTLNRMGRLEEAYEIVRAISLKVPESDAFKKLLKDIQERNAKNLVFE